MKILTPWLGLLGLVPLLRVFRGSLMVGPGATRGVLAGGARPPALAEPRPQAGIQQHAGIGFELVLALDAPVLHMGEEVGDYDFLHSLPDHLVQLIVQEITVSSSVHRGSQPMDVEQVVIVPVLVFLML